MIHHEKVAISTSSSSSRSTLTRTPQASSVLLLLCTITLILSTLFSITPLYRQAATPLLSSLPTNAMLAVWGSWLPINLHVAQNSRVSQASTANIEFIVLMIMAFVAYGLAALLLRLQPKDARQTYSHRLIWGGTVVVGLIFVLTPAMLSHDALVYADYGRSIVAHGSNPYFIAPLQVSPLDPITRVDDWKASTAAYGPFWLYICSFWATMLGDNPVRYIFAYRLMGLAAHALNLLLVTIILKKTESPSRTVALGALLYAYNPLVLLEGSMGGHNDIVMVTMLLLGTLLCIRAEHMTSKPFVLCPLRTWRGQASPLHVGKVPYEFNMTFTQLRYYVPPLLFLTLATLIKFTALPMVIFFLILLGRKTLLAASDRTPLAQWSAALLNIFVAGIIYLLVSLALYLPFWLGHSFSTIVQSFAAPPSSYYAENSFLRFAVEWMKLHGSSGHNSHLYTLMRVVSLHSTWSTIDMLALVCTGLVGMVLLWRLPTSLTMVLATLLALDILLIVTPWFYQWYVLWLVGLAAIVLTRVDTRVGQAVIASALTFSLTAFCTYFSNIYTPKFEGVGLQSLATLIPPAIVLIGLLLLVHKKRLTTFSHS